MSSKLRVFPASFSVALLLSLCACGGAGPDTGDAGTRFLEQVNLETEGKAKLLSFAETSRKFERAGDIEGCTVDFEGEIEFTDRAYYQMRERKAGERMKFDASIEYVKGEDGWQQLIAGIHAR